MTPQASVREIAITSLGRNMLVAGLMCHMVALMAGMTMTFGAKGFFMIVYPVSWLLFVVGIYAELSGRGGHPLTAGRFYVMAALAVVPLLGPGLVLAGLYSLSGGESEAAGKYAGLMGAILRLRANLLVLFLVLMILLMLFAVFNRQSDPYFKKRDRYHSDGQSHLFRCDYPYPQIISGQSADLPMG